MSSQSGHPDVAKLLLANGTNVNQARNDGATPLLVRSQFGHQELVRLLLARGAKGRTSRFD